MDKLLQVSGSPHVHGDESVKKIMWSVVIALLPALAVSVFYFGLPVLILTLVSIATCMLTEYLIQRFMLKGNVTITDGSAVITGLLLAFNVPSNLPVWILMIGAFVAIAIAKMPFGGLGKNPFNPALVGRAFLLISFPVSMTTWPQPGITRFVWNVDAMTAATPLGNIKLHAFNQLPDYWDLFIGTVGGSLGETSALAILLGGLFLIYKKIISWHIPFFFLATIFVFTGIAWLVDPEAFVNPLYHILGGGVMLGAFFMLTDMVTSPMNPKGQIIFAVGAGIICSCIRLWGAYPEGCMFSILIMNAFVPLIDKYIKPKRFGSEVNYGG